jgi:hypothetical protein
MSPEYLFWYLPIVVAVSMVLAGTRHERNDLILRQSWNNVIWITMFMLIISGILWFASLWI